MQQLKLPVPAGAAAVSSWADVIVTDDPPGLNGYNPEGS
jgi:hypothetical protein